MIPLPDNTTDRLLAVADIIEFTPERWEQDLWFTDDPGTEDPDGFNFPGPIFGRGFVECGSAGCVAGWAVALSPEIHSSLYDWDAAGAAALGITDGVAHELFDGSLKNRMSNVELADALRRIAKLDEGERDVAQVADVLTCDQNDALFGECRGCMRGDA